MNGKLRISFLLCLSALLVSFASCGGGEEGIGVEEMTATTDMGMTDTGYGTDTGMGTDMVETYPEFPWPPPQASARAVIPRQLLANPTGTTTLLSDVDRRLTAALDRNGYFEHSYYAVPKGFALVTRMEQMNADGTAKQGSERWVVERQPLKQFSLNEYLRALLTAAPGRYRIIVFIVTPYSFSQTRAAVTSEEASEWLSQGMDQLPTPIGRSALAGEDLKCTALIYDFERVSDVSSPKHRKPSPLLGRIHLEKSGIWGGLTNAD